MYSQTNSQGIATLTVPQAPIQVSSSLSVPVNLPKTVSTMPVTIGGQTVNVTVYWQPMYVYLSGSALIIPPQTSATVTLLYQQSNIVYPLQSGSSPLPPGVTYSSTGTATAQQGGAQSSTGSGQAASTQGLSAPAAKISPFVVTPNHSTVATTGDSAPSSTASATKVSSNGGGSMLLLGIAAIVTVAVVVVGLVLYTARGKQ